ILAGLLQGAAGDQRVDRLREDFQGAGVVGQGTLVVTARTLLQAGLHELAGGLGREQIPDLFEDFLAGEGELGVGIPLAPLQRGKRGLPERAQLYPRLGPRVGVGGAELLEELIRTRSLEHREGEEELEHEGPPGRSTKSLAARRSEAAKIVAPPAEM